MKKIFIVLPLLLFLVGGGAFYYFYQGSVSLDITGGAPQEVQTIPSEEQYLVEIPSFQVPVLHNRIAVKTLVFHVVLNMKNGTGKTFAQASIPQLLDLYIRYLVAYYELNDVQDRVDGVQIRTIIRRATTEVMGGIDRVDQVIIQGVYITE